MFSVLLISGHGELETGLLTNQLHKDIPYQLKLDKYKTKLFDVFSHATIV